MHVARRTVRRGTVCLAAALAVVTLGAAVAMAAPDKQEFIQQADAVCTKASADTSKQIDEQLPELATQSQAPHGAQLKTYVNIVISNIKKEIKGIKALGLPKGDEAQLNKLFAAVSKGLKTLKKHPEVLTGTGSNPLAKASQLALAYGFTVCGQGS